MNLDLLFVILFFLILLGIYFKYKNKFEVQSKVFVLYKTKWGLKLMDKLASKFPRFLKYLSYVSVFIGFAGMVFIFYFLIMGTYNLLFIPKSQPLLAPVLPGVKVAGLPTLSFFHWIIAILFIAGIHEFFHGVYARAVGVKIKSSGFAFLGPILAAFVEPDEKQLAKKKKFDQLAVFSAGPFINIIAAFLILLCTLYIVNPVAYNFVEQTGVQVVSLVPGNPAELSGIKVGEEIKFINNFSVNNIDDFSKSLANIKPNEKIIIQTLNSTYTLTTTQNPKNSKEGYLGISVSANKVVAKGNYGNVTVLILNWIMKLFFWLYAISLGVGLFNLLPLGPVDGGRMFNTGILYFIKNKKIARKVYITTSLFCLLLIFINLFPYLIKLLLFIVKPILFLI
ncbi:MAG: site-2 protease family protein [Candidatus Nanoarchaeia archaeon]|nr:site-2 protease family protein [Candidatus Nanoarchaeia archaeon]MDD5587960.1 site-2 protease family protein [Candidatus Nanoarchaeia archaeon]